MTKDEHEIILKEIAESEGDTAVIVEKLDMLRNDYSSTYSTLTEIQSKYNDLKEKYVERFFTTPETVKAEAAQDVKRDGTKQTFEELFERREG